MALWCFSISEALTGMDLNKSAGVLAPTQDSGWSYREPRWLEWTVDMHRNWKTPNLGLWGWSLALCWVERKHNNKQHFLRILSIYTLKLKLVALEIKVKSASVIWWMIRGQRLNQVTSDSEVIETPLSCFLPIEFWILIFIESDFGLIAVIETPPSCYFLWLGLAEPLWAVAGDHRVAPPNWAPSLIFWQDITNLVHWQEITIIIIINIIIV